MKIGSLDTQVAPLPSAPDRKGSPAAAVSPLPPVAAEPSAKVDLSAAAAAGNAAGGDGSFDSAKVDRIAQAIRDGQFSINAEAIADKLIANAKELLSPGKSN